MLPDVGEGMEGHTHTVTNEALQTFPFDFKRSHRMTVAPIVAPPVYGRSSQTISTAARPCASLFVQSSNSFNGRVFDTQI